MRFTTFMSSLLLAATVYGQSTIPSGNAVGDMPYWNGTSWALIPAGKPGQILTISTDNVPVWKYQRYCTTMSDIDGNIYNTIRIGNQEWTVENLRTTHYNDGTVIPNITDDNAWGGLTTGAYCYYDNTTDAAEQQKWGALYNWYAVNTGKLAPKGWHVSTNAEWDTLQNYLIAHGYNWDGTTTGNKTAKSLAAKSDWQICEPNGVIGNNLDRNNRSGFSALGGGDRWNDGIFYNRSICGFWWSATGYGTLAWYRSLYNNHDYLNRSYWAKNCGFSVRLVRD